MDICPFAPPDSPRGDDRAETPAALLGGLPPGPPVPVSVTLPPVQAPCVSLTGPASVLPALATVILCRNFAAGYQRQCQPPWESGVRRLPLCRVPLALLPAHTTLTTESPPFLLLEQTRQLQRPTGMVPPRPGGPGSQAEGQGPAEGGGVDASRH